MEKTKKGFRKTMQNIGSDIKQNYKSMLLAFGGVFLVALLGSLLVDTTSAWFNSLIKPAFYPPNYLFSVMWTILYLMLAVALYLVLIKNTNNKKVLQLFVINGVLNVLWNLVFFRFHSAFFGVLVLVVLIIFAYFLVKEVYEKNKVSFYLTVPYFLWLFFAFLLNYSIYFLN
jgi:tryptophan-rich sensory protein